MIVSSLTINSFVILDDCDCGEPFQSTPDIDEAACQGYCGVVYEGRCTFYEYDKDARTCNVFDTPVPDYLAACSNLGGPKQPPIESCSIFVDPCIVRIYLEPTCCKSQSYMIVISGVRRRHMQLRWKFTGNP